MGEFVLFGTTHLLTLSIIFVASFGFAYFAKSNYSEQAYLPFEKFFGCLLIANELFKPLLLTTFGDYKWTNTVPLHMCHLSSYAAGLFLLTRDKRFFDFAYFWGLGGGTMALLTPDVRYTFPHLDFITLFFGHGILFFAVIYVVITLKQVITFSSLVNAMKYSFCMLPFIYLLNLGIDQIADPKYPPNLWYLMHLPKGASLIDSFPDFFRNPPWHIIPTIPLSFIIFLLLYSPFYLSERK